KLSVGPWFTQMDEFLVSGESLIRNLEWGLADAEDLAGLEPREAIGYLPDQFGHAAQMPQILSNAGVHRAMVWRGVPSAVDSLTFRWAGPDGSEVLAEYLLSGYWLGGALLACDDAECLAKAIDTCVRTLAPLAALVPGVGWPRGELERCWRLLLWNGAHDSVCGCGVDEVARDVDARCAEVRTIAGRIRDEALAMLASRVRQGGVLRFNPSPFE